ncbi:hypothetical protein E8L99_22025 [Phreatobacter aquaticus]|uniref:DUF3617 family protein n=1 Tax=Phreatobacter aquaticus TaxID=2570229 RepID=A0A4D7QLZ2_9HYPH|nr:hypothetical protein [Phreatobacter aquaticus]QCK88245.1 hypothetical protein E8L99_22025 [Phreatobacter aquaticus]
MLYRLALATLLIATVPALAQPRAAERRSTDFAGQWASQPGGRAGVEIRVSGHQIEAREVFTTRTASSCGTRGGGQVNGLTANIRFQGICADGRTTSDTRCTVTLETRDRIKTSCRNGHTAVLHRVGR